MQFAALRALVPEPVKAVYRAVQNRRHFGGADYPEIFRIVFERNYWLSDESRSGLGSTVAFTSCLRRELAAWLRGADISSFVDLPCGDFNWMRHVDFPAGTTYFGLDIVEEIVAGNQAAYGSEKWRFEVGDILAPGLPAADAYFCRDLLIHFPNEAVDRAIANVRATGARYLLATTYPAVRRNRDTRFPDSRRQNLALLLGEPEALLPDFGEGVRDKYIGVWRLS